MMQKEVFGYGIAKQELQKIVGRDKVFLVTGKQSFFKSGAMEVARRLDICGRFYDFDTNIKAADIERGRELFKKFDCNIIVAVGGGSVIDMGKMVSTSKEEVELVAVPTTAGSGAEATSFAAVYNSKEKYSVKAALPDFVILDPKLTESMPKYLTACTGMDALCHAIESRWAKGATKESIELSEAAADLIYANLPEAVNKPTKEVREDMMKGANLAGKAINIANTTAPHALSYSLTIRFGIPHGHAAALMLRAFTDYKIKELMESIGLETRLSKLGVKEEDLIGIVEDVNEERLSNFQRKLSKEDLIKTLESVL